MQPWFFADRPRLATGPARRAEALSGPEIRALAEGLRHRAKPFRRAA